MMLSCQLPFYSVCIQGDFILIHVGRSTDSGKYLSSEVKGRGQACYWKKMFDKIPELSVLRGVSVSPQFSFIYPFCKQMLRKHESAFMNVFRFSIMQQEYISNWRFLCQRNNVFYKSARGRYRESYVLTRKEAGTSISSELWSCSGRKKWLDKLLY